MLPTHVGLGGLQALLGGALGGEFVAHADDGVGLAGVALFHCLQALGGDIRAGLGGGDALLLRPDKQAERGDQGEAVEELPEGGHAACSCPPQPQPAWRW